MLFRFIFKYSIVIFIIFPWLIQKHSLNWFDRLQALFFGLFFIDILMVRGNIIALIAFKGKFFFSSWVQLIPSLISFYQLTSTLLVFDRNWFNELIIWYRLVHWFIMHFNTVFTKVVFRPSLIDHLMTWQRKHIMIYIHRTYHNTYFCF